MKSKAKSLIFFLFAYVTMVNANTNKYRLTLRDNPATSIVVGWNQVSGTNAVVYYGTMDLGTNWSAYPNSKTVDRSVSYKGMNNRFAYLAGLQPNTNYYFVIRDNEGTSDRFWFKTGSNNPADRLSFIAGGDSRNNRTPRINANKLVAKLKPDAVLFGGDMTNGDSNSEWSTWFDDWQYTIASDGRMFPIVATRGNHESSNNSIYNLFDVPSSNVYYAITFGGSLIRSYTLNTEMSISGNQTTWLNSDLQSNNNTTWKMAQYHKPMRPHVSSKSEGSQQYGNWAQSFFDYGVKLVVECDAHTVKTTWPVRPSSTGGSDEGFVRDDENGTVYAGEGCWGAPLRSNNDNKAWTRNSAMFNQFKWIFVDQAKIEVRTIKVDNANQVGEVSNGNRFVAPTNLDVWNPSNGSVVTITGNLDAPTCNIASPTNGQSYSSPQDISINANASDEDGNVTNVEFFVNGTSIGTDSTSPYSRSYSIPADGAYAITAIATDNDGLTSTSSTVNFTVGVVAQTLERRIASGLDDVEENGTNGSIYTNSSDMELVNDGSKGNQIVGLRFTGIAVPQGATITKAYIQFTVDETSSVTTNLSIRGHDTNDAAVFTSATNNVSNRATTTASVTWSPSSWNSVGASGTNERTPEMKAIVQEIVNRSGWSPGNDMAMIISGTGERIAEAYEGVSGSAALLHLEYTVGVSPTGTCSTVQIDFNDFESNYGTWNDGGSDCTRTSNATYAKSGAYSVRLRDDTSGSRMYTDTMNLSDFDEVTISFSYICNSMDNGNEDFWLQLSENGGASYTTVEEWNRGDEFVNNVRYDDAVTLQGPFTTTTRFRFVCDASSNGDQVYLDDILISGCLSNTPKNLSPIKNSGLITVKLSDDGLSENQESGDDLLEDMLVYPNPFKTDFKIEFLEAVGSGMIELYNLQGELIYQKLFRRSDEPIVVDPNGLSIGVYYLKVKVGNASVLKKMVKK